MSHVAFETNAQASNTLRTASTRSSQSADRGTSSSFDSLIDDSLPETPRASDDNAPRADRPDRQPSKSADRPDRGSRSDDRSRSADTESDAPAKVDAAAAKGTDDAQKSKEPKESQGSKDTKADGDTEAATADAIKNAATDDAGTAADAAMVATAIAAQTPAAVALTVTVGATANAEAAQPAADDGTVAAGDAQKAQLAALAALQAQAGGKVDGKSKDPAALKGDAKSDKADTKADAKADAGKATLLTPAELEAAAKVQGTGEAETDTGAHAQAKTAADTHRGATPDAQAKTASDDTIATPKATADITQTTLPQTPAHQTQAQTTIAAAAPASTQQTPEPAVPLNGVGIEIASKALSGKNQFDIRLDPPELGRIHVRLDVDHKGNVITHMVADRTDTLDMLRRDSASLERALQDAGLKTSDNGMQFSLRDQSANQQQSGGERAANAAHIVVEDDQIPAAIARDYARMGTRAGGLDIKV